MNPTKAGMTTALKSYCGLFDLGTGTSTLVGYSGTMPSMPETPITTQTALITATYATPNAFSQPPYSTIGNFLIATASFYSTHANQFKPSDTGAITFFRALSRNGTPLGDFTVGSTWLPSTLVPPNMLATVGQYCINNNNIYLCTGTGFTDYSGGPQGTTSGIQDGTATWDYVGPANNAWATNKNYSRGDIVTNGGNSYLCAVSGTSATTGTGPTGTGQAIPDGTVRWNYLAQAPYFDVMMGNCNVSPTTGTAETWITITQTLVVPFV